MNLHHGDTRIIIDTCRKYGLLRNQAAYVLATAFHETAGTMRPVRETLAKSDAKAKEILTKAWKAGKLPWVKRDYWSSGYFGRGYVQLTHEANYRFAGERLGVPLAERPSIALEPDIAAEIIVQGMGSGWFTGKDLAQYITISKSDFYSARVIVNGDKAQNGAKIATYAKEYDRLLKADGYGEGTNDFPVPEPEPRPIPGTENRSLPTEPVVVHVDPNGEVKPGKSEPHVERNPFWAGLFAILKAIFRRGK